MKAFKRHRWATMLFLCGLFILSFPHIAQYINADIQKMEAKQFKQMNKQLPEEIKEQKINESKKCNESIFEADEQFYDPFTASYHQSYQHACRHIMIDKDSFGTIEIPKINVEIPIYLGATDNELSKGIGLVEGSSLPIGGDSTHTLLAGHRGMGTKAMFRNLDVLEKNDSFFIHTIDGRLEYKVYDVLIILPDETDELRIVEGEDYAS